MSTGVLPEVLRLTPMVIGYSKCRLCSLGSILFFQSLAGFRVLEKTIHKTEFLKPRGLRLLLIFISCRIRVVHRNRNIVESFALFLSMFQFSQVTQVLEFIDAVRKKDVFWRVDAVLHQAVRKDNILPCNFLKAAHFLDQELPIVNKRFQFEVAELLARVTRTSLAEKQFIQTLVL